MNGTGAYAGLDVAQRRAIAESTFLPRPARSLESRQYTLDAKLDVPFELAGRHVAVLGAQVIRGELEDGVFGMEDGIPGGVQEHKWHALFAVDTRTITAPQSIPDGLRWDDHVVLGARLSMRLYGVWTMNAHWTVKGGVST